MKVILMQAVPKLGKAGQVVNVKQGYARNFLFPQGMATVADRTQLQVLERRNAKIQKDLDATKAAAEALAERINGKHLKFEAKAGADRARLFGAVTSQDIADLIKKELGETVEKKDVLLLRPIKRLGTYDIELDVHRNVDIALKLEVFDPEVLLEEEAKKKAEAQAADVEVSETPVEEVVSDESVVEEVAEEVASEETGE